MKTVALAFVAFGACAFPAHADCVARYSTKFGDRSDGSIVGVVPAKPCTVAHTLRGSRGLGRETTLQVIEVVRQPHHGLVRASGASFTYTPNNGFAGKDSFFVRYVFTNAQGERRTAGVRFAVSQ